MAQLSPTKVIRAKRVCSPRSEPTNVCRFARPEKTELIGLEQIRKNGTDQIRAEEEISLKNYIRGRKVKDNYQVSGETPIWTEVMTRERGTRPVSKPFNCSGINNSAKKVGTG
ncbi:hypothetical protein TNCV_2774181 [Trichonephila clavipes]|nr:hypothetical protein TNCV_2774181 [Trichonephila clavipes]